MEKSRAIIIGRHRLTETSLIIKWCTAEAGLVKTVAKGALRPKSAFAGRLDLFITADIRWVRHRSGDLHQLGEVEVADGRLALRESYLRVLAATYLVRLAEMMVEPETPTPELYELLGKALDYLTTHEPSRAMVERFELRLTEMLGIQHDSGRPATALKAYAHRELPVQREQLWERLELK